MARNDYTALDAAIIKGIEAGAVTFAALVSLVKELAKPHTEGTRSPFPTPPGRVVDRRLQALRKRGVLSFGKGKWSISKGSAAT